MQMELPEIRKTYRPYHQIASEGASLLREKGWIDRRMSELVGSTSPKKGRVC